MIVAHSITKYTNYDEHAILFEFGGKNFEVLIVDKHDEIFVSECLLLEGRTMIEIDIFQFFGGFSPDIFQMLYNRVHEPEDENDVEHVESGDSESE